MSNIRPDLFVEGEAWLTPAEVAAIFRIDPQTLATWRKRGKIPYKRTPGGHARYWEPDVKAILRNETPPSWANGKPTEDDED